MFRFQNTVAQIYDRDYQFEDEHTGKQTKKCPFYFIPVLLKYGTTPS